MSISQLLIGTGNTHKLAEISNILLFNHIDLLSLIDFHALEEPAEDGDSFAENALIKARYYFKNFGIPCLADDSGLEVEALNGAPGIYSSRFSGQNANDTGNNQLLLEKMNGIKSRSANFVCVAAYKDANTEKLFEGKFHGKIGFAARGENGFGYDPLFYIELDGETRSVAELTTAFKNSISHRAIAVRRFETWFKSYLAKNKS